MKIRYEQLSEIVQEEFPDVVLDSKIVVDGSYMDIWFSRKIPGRFAYHWERREVNGTVYRHDNRPHRNLKNIGSFPKHFHNGREQNIVESGISDDPTVATREFLKFVRERTK